MMGGIAFDTPTSLETGGAPQPGHLFKLYESREDIFERTFTQKEHYILHFEGSIRGLAIGAPVEFRGIKIGQVLDIKFVFNQETLAPEITVLIETEPQRWQIMGQTELDEKEQMQALVDKGLRAQLKTGSLLTGQLYVDWDFHENAPPVKVNFDGLYPEMPTVPAPLQMITARISDLLNKIETIPIEKIGKDLGASLHNVKEITESKELLQAVQSLNKTLQETSELAQNFNTNVTPAITATLDQAQQTLVSVEGTLGKDAPLQHELRQALQELGDAARALRILLDYLERHPDALIFGKGQTP
jgi:paraquat-inducible protein B